MAFRPKQLHAHEPIQPSHPQDDGAGAAGQGAAMAEIRAQIDLTGEDETKSVEVEG